MNISLNNELHKNLEYVSRLKAESITTFLGEQEKQVNGLQEQAVFINLLKEYNEKGYNTNETFSEANIQMNLFAKKMAILSKDGIVLISWNNPPGTDYSNESYFKNHMEIIYTQVYYDVVIKKYGLATGGPIYDPQTKELIGYAVIDILSSELSDVVAPEWDLKDNDRMESYLINSKKILLTSSESLGNLTSFTQLVDTIASNSCLNESNEAGESQEGISLKNTYLNYEGREVLGAYSYLEGTNWCLITEIEKDAVFAKPSKIFFYYYLFASLISIAGFLFFIFSFSRHIKTRNLNKDKILYSFLNRKIHLLYFIILGIVYSFMLIYFSNAAKNETILQNSIDALVITLFFIIAGYAFRLKKLKTKKLVFFGALLKIISSSILLRFIRIPSPLLFFVIIYPFIELIGYLLLLFGIKEVMRK